MVTTSRVTIVVVTCNSADVLAGCLDSIELAAGGCPTIVVDNASADRSVHIAGERPFVNVIRSGTNEGFSKANNRALHAIETEFALLLNPDARLTPSAIPGLLAAADRRPEAAALGPKTVFEDGRPQVSFGPDLSPLAEYRQGRLVKGVKAGEGWAVEALRAATDHECYVDWVSGSCMLLKMSAARAVGFFDERYFLYEEDADLCLRLRKAGGRVLLVPGALVLHQLGTAMIKASVRSRRAYDESHRLYYRLHRSPGERLLLGLFLAIKKLLGR
jgi:GT2 family glycosyltransferase